MLRLEYPFKHVQGRWFWGVSVSDRAAIRIANPCDRDCSGHLSWEDATRHHANMLISQGYIEKVQNDICLRCVLCNVFTVHQVRLRACPYHEWVPMCVSHDPMPYLTERHFARRGIEIHSMDELRNDKTFELQASKRLWRDDSEQELRSYVAQD